MEVWDASAFTSLGGRLSDPWNGPSPGRSAVMVDGERPARHQYRHSFCVRQFIDAKFARSLQFESGKDLTGTGGAAKSWSCFSASIMARAA